MKACWHQKDKKRPSFPVILQKLAEMLPTPAIPKEINTSTAESDGSVSYVCPSVRECRKAFNTQLSAMFYSLLI